MCYKFYPDIQTIDANAYLCQKIGWNSVTYICRMNKLNRGINLFKHHDAILLLEKSHNWFSHEKREYVCNSILTATSFKMNLWNSKFSCNLIGVQAQENKNPK